MTLLSTLSTVAPYHVLLYSLTFGATTYQTFYIGLVAFRVLPYAAFANLQQKVFPTYFRAQTVLSGLLLLTQPTQSLSTVSATTLGMALAGGLINAAVLGPKSHVVLAKRLKQSEKEGKSHKDPTASDEMKKLNKQFGVLHGISVLTNMGVWLSFMTYGVELTSILMNM